MRSRWRTRVLRTAASIVGVLGAAVTPATAHDGYSPRGIYLPVGNGTGFPRFTFRDPWQCLGTGSSQKHTFREVLTLSYRGDCATPYVLGARQIVHRGWIYRNGQICIQGGWQYNSTPDSQLYWSVSEDLWHQCNVGWGNAVRISSDIESGILYQNTGYAVFRQARWPDGTLPTTYHDH